MSTPAPLRRVLGAGAALVFLGVGGLAACSTSGDDDATPTTTTTTTTTAPVDESTTTTTAGGTTSTTDGEPTTSTTPPTTAPSPTTTVAGPPSGDDAAYVAGMRTYLEDDDEIFEDGQIDCMAEGLVAVVGAERFRAAGVSPDDMDEPFEALRLDDDTANAMYDVLDDCADGIREAMVASLAESAGPEADPDTRACVDRNLTEDLAREVFVALFRGQEPPTGLTAALRSCA